MEVAVGAQARQHSQQRYRISPAAERHNHRRTPVEQSLTLYILFCNIFKFKRIHNKSSEPR